MYKTGQEILSQFDALKKTYNYMLGMAGEIRSFAGKTPFRSITFTGCGSSYSLCKSAETSYKLRSGKPANAVAAGDLMVNFEGYKAFLGDTLLVAPSRSGSTSEVILAVQKAVDKLGVRCVSIAARENTEMGKTAGLSLEIPWAFDNSVCQTRTVTNLYLADLIFIGILLEDDTLLKELHDVISRGSSFIEQARHLAEAVVNNESWERVVVLADSELAGIAEEGALAFNEICRISSNYYHVLDVRHGPMVLINKKTLVIMACSPYETIYQKELIKDLKSREAVVVTVSSNLINIWGSDYNITVPEYKNYGVNGVPFILMPQLISYYKALKEGINPDLPDGLEPWIVL